MSAHDVYSQCMLSKFISLDASIHMFIHMSVHMSMHFNLHTSKSRCPTDLNGPCMAVCALAYMLTRTHVYVARHMSLRMSMHMPTNTKTQIAD